MKGYMILSLIFLTVFAVGCNDPTGNTIRFTGPIDTCDTVRTPYQVTEDYQTPMKYEVIGSTQSETSQRSDMWAVSEVTVKNMDTEAGTFTVSQTFQTLKDSSKTFSTSADIMPGESMTFREEYGITVGEDFIVSYNVQPPSKTITQTVTKYRNEEICE